MNGFICISKINILVDVMVRGGYEFYTMESNDFFFENSNQDVNTKLLIQELSNQEYSDFSNLFHVLQKDSVSKIYNKSDLNDIACLYLRLGEIVNTFHQSIPAESGEDRQSWLEFYYDLYKVLEFDKYAELWQEAAFSQLDELLDFCWESYTDSGQLDLLIYLQCFHANEKKDALSFAELKMEYQTIALNTYLKFLADSTHKAFAVRTLVSHTKGMSSPVASDESVLFICQQVSNEEISIAVKIELFKQFQLSNELIPEVVKCVLKEVSKESEYKFEDQAYILDLITSLDCEDFWLSIKDKTAIFLDQKSNFSPELKFPFSSLTKKYNLSALKFWHFMMAEGVRSPRIYKCFYKYFFVLVDEYWKEMTLPEAKGFLEGYYRVVADTKDIEGCIEKAGFFLVYLTAKEKFTVHKGDSEVSRQNIVSYIVDLFSSVEIPPRYLLEALGISARIVRSVSLKVAFEDRYLELVKMFHYSTFEDKRDLAFYLLASRNFTDYPSIIWEICPVPINYQPPVIEDSLFQTVNNLFFQENGTVLCKERILKFMFKYYRFNSSQVAQLITAACQASASEKGGTVMSLDGYGSLLTLISVCFSHAKPICFSDDQRAIVVRALKPYLFIRDLRGMFKQNDADPIKTYLDPTLSKLEEVVTSFDLAGHDIIESYYRHMNVAIQHYLRTRVVDLKAKVILKNSSTNVDSKRKGRRFTVCKSFTDEFMRSVERLPFDHFQKDLMLVGNYCKHKLEGHRFYESSTFFD